MNKQAFEEFFGGMDCDPKNINDLPQSEQDEYQQWARQHDKARKELEDEYRSIIPEQFWTPKSR